MLVVMALPMESRGRLERSGAPLVYTGVGKVNASMTLARELASRRAAGRLPAVVINFGTAGSRRIPTGRLVECTHFFQRDMDVRALGFARGETPFDPAPRVLESPRFFPQLASASCSTADSFATDGHEVDADVTDMEAFALARVCLAEGVRFAAAKYVTDGADGSAAADWADALDAAASAFAELYASIDGREQPIGDDAVRVR
jgi:adenosylhomocysteine nucleosidase